MELNKWYKLPAQNEESFVNESHSINTSILKYINGRKFKIVELNEDEDGVLAILLEGDFLPIRRIEALPQYPINNYSEGWFYSTEFMFFDEVEEPGEGEIYIVIVSGIEAKEYGGATGYIVGSAGNPTRFTLAKAKEHAEFVLKDNQDGCKVEIFRLETTAQVVSEIKFS